MEISVDGRPLRTLAVPHANINGNTKEQLVEHCINIRQAISSLARIMRAGAADLGHGRNFTHTDNSEQSSKWAINAWYDRLRVLDHMYRELEDLAIRIDDSAPNAQSE